MKIIYTGPNPHAFHSAPSGFDYLFDPGVAQTVKKEDQKFFKNRAKIEGSNWEIGGWKTKIEPTKEGGKK